MLRIIRNSIAHSGFAQLRNYLDNNNEIKKNASIKTLFGNTRLIIEDLDMAEFFISQNKAIIKMEPDFTFDFNEKFCIFSNQLFRRVLETIFNAISPG